MLVITIGLDQQNVESKIVNIFLSVNSLNVFWVPKEPSHRDGSFENPQCMFWLRYKKSGYN